MFENLQSLKENFKSLEEKIADPETMKDMDKWQKMVKEHADLKPIIEKYDEYIQNKHILEEDKEMLGESLDDDMRDMLKEEVSAREKDINVQEQELKVLLLPKDPNDDKNVFIEIRAGAGGDEAGLFAGELLRMYNMYADNQNWKTELMDINEQGVGGIKEAVFMVKGQGAYSKLKYESGVHRVQRVPATESSGRIHTSAATVAVLPEADDVDVHIEQKDLRVDVFRSSGNGGQSVNTTDSAVRITHLPTGIVVSCQDEKSQLKNKDKAMKILKSRLYDQMLEEQNKELADERKSQVGSGDRSERIRTYNFPQGRVTDHRINKTSHQLEDFLDGNIQDMIDALITYDQAEKLKYIGDDKTA
ncbi:MAG: peptide chain release factor 1 [Gallicola sp.]|nr:peptide chain release factor 1 [Gallicola sp.]